MSSLARHWSASFISLTHLCGLVTQVSRGSGSFALSFTSPLQLVLQICAAGTESVARVAAFTSLAGCLRKCCEFTLLARHVVHSANAKNNRLDGANVRKVPHSCLSSKAETSCDNVLITYTWQQDRPRHGLHLNPCASGTSWPAAIWVRLRATKSFALSPATARSAAEALCGPHPAPSCEMTFQTACNKGYARFMGSQC